MSNDGYMAICVLESVSSRPRRHDWFGEGENVTGDQECAPDFSSSTRPHVQVSRTRLIGGNRSGPTQHRAPWRSRVVIHSYRLFDCQLAVDAEAFAAPVHAPDFKSGVRL